MSKNYGICMNLTYFFKITTAFLQVSEFHLLHSCGKNQSGACTTFSLSIHLLLDTKVHCIVRILFTEINVDLQVSLCCVDLDYFDYTAKSATAVPSRCSIFSCKRKHHTKFSKVWASVHHRNEQKMPLNHICTSIYYCLFS